VDGLIIAPVAPNHAFLEAELEAGVAVVFVDRPPAAIEADAVLIDNAGAAATAVDHLVARGHTRIGFLGDREELFTARERLGGYRESLVRHGVPYDDGLVRMGLADAEVSNAATVELLGAPGSPTALLTSQNLVTVGAVHALQALGRHHEVALVGIDDVPMADAVEPRITVVAQDPVALGRAAGEVLFARLDGELGPRERVIVPTEFIVRGSGEIPPLAGSRGRNPTLS
jgi:LacI family transcriptional regulator